MKYCPKCGSLVDDNEMYCPNCGMPLEANKQRGDYYENNEK